jgi:hypothetical protein
MPIEGCTLLYYHSMAILKYRHVDPEIAWLQAH